MQTNQINPAGMNSIEKLLAKFLPNSKQVNEEELFTGIIASKLTSIKESRSRGALSKTVDAFMQKADSYKRRVQLEDASLQALDALVTQKKITKPERDKIYTESFRAAQLDGDATKLFDSKGSKNDPTIAVLDRDKAIVSAIGLIKQIDSGSIKAEMPQSTSSVKSSSRSASGMPPGFLFKPVSSNSGTVAVLIPADMGRNSQSVRLVDSQGNEIEKGRFTSFGETGEKAKYSFSKPGSGYPKDISVEIVLKDGTRSLIPISDPSKRYE